MVKGTCLAAPQRRTGNPQKLGLGSPRRTAPAQRAQELRRPTAPPLSGLSRRLPDRLHRCCWVHIARPSPPSGPCRSAITTTPRNRIVLPVVTAVGSTLPDHHNRAWEPRCPPGRHRHPVHASPTLFLSLSLSFSLYKFCFAVFGCLAI
jgi:hypothetical protein